MPAERLTRSGLVSLVGSAVAALGALALTSLVGHSLGAHGTGLFFQAVGIFTVLTQVLRLGTSSGVVRFIAAERAHDRRGQEWRVVLLAVVPVGAASALAAIGLWVWSEALSTWMSGEATSSTDLAALLRLMAPFVVVGAVSGVLQIATRMVRGVTAFTMLQSVLPAVSRLAAVAVSLMALTTAGAAFAAWLLPLPLWLVAGLLLVLRPLLADRRVEQEGVTIRDRIGWRRFWRFNGPRAVGSGLETGLQWTDVLIVAALTTPAEAGVYAVATRAVRAGEIVDKAMRVAVAPTISSLLARDDKRGASDLHARVVRGMVIVSWPFYIVLALNGEAVLAVFGPEFAEGWPILSILAAAMMCQTAAGMLQSVLLQGGRSSWQMWNKAVVLCVSIALNLVLIPVWGIAGAAMTWAIVVLLDNGLAAYQVHRRMGVRLRPHEYLLVATTALAVFGIGSLAGRVLGGSSVGWLLLSTALTSASYAAVLWLLRRPLQIEGLWAKVPIIGPYVAARSSAPRSPGSDAVPPSATGAAPEASGDRGARGSPVPRARLRRERVSHR